MKQMTLEQLAEHDGSRPGVPLMLSIQGTVYNITSGKQYYGPDGECNHTKGLPKSCRCLVQCIQTLR